MRSRSVWFQCQKTISFTQGSLHLKKRQLLAVVFWYTRTYSGCISCPENFNETLGLCGNSLNNQIKIENSKFSICLYAAICYQIHWPLWFMKEFLKNLVLRFTYPKDVRPCYVCLCSRTLKTQTTTGCSLLCL